MVEFYKHRIGKQYMFVFRIGWFKLEWFHLGSNFVFRFEINNWDHSRDNKIKNKGGQHGFAKNNS